jgi:hypothetical protein
MRALTAWAAPLFLGLSLAAAAHAQTGVGVEVDEVIDNRISAGMQTGDLEIRVKLKGTGLERVMGARLVLKDAKDDRGNALPSGSFASADYTPRDENNGVLRLSLRQPARAASSVRIKGTVELYAPGRDPASVVRVDQALAHLDKPLSAKLLKAEKVDLTLLSPAGYAALMKSRKITDDDVTKIRAEGKAHGASDKEIEAVIAMAKAMESLDAEPSEGTVLLSGSKSAFARIFRIEVLGEDGKPMNVPERGLSTRGEASVMTIKPSAKPPQNASLQLYVLTAKSRLSIPFELEVPLP